MAKRGTSHDDVQCNQANNGHLPDGSFAVRLQQGQQMDDAELLCAGEDLLGVVDQQGTGGIEGVQFL